MPLIDVFSDQRPPAIRRRRAMGVAAIAILVLVNGCRPSPPPDPDTVATVGSVSITVPEVEAELARQGTAAGDPDTRRRRALDGLIDEAGIYEQARAAGFDRSPELQRRWRQLVTREWRDRALAGSETNALSEAELKAWYDANPERFRQPGRVRAGVITLKVHARAEAERREAARRTLAEAREAILGAKDREAAFQQFARDRSEDPATRHRGGNTGWLALGQVPLRWPEEIGSELGRLSEPGALSPVIETPSGFFLLALWQHEAPSVKPFAQVRDVLEHPARLAREERRAREFAAAARDAAPARLHPEALARVRVPAPPATLAHSAPPALPKSGTPIVSQP